MNARPPIRVGIVGCGEIAQVMHLPILHELGAFAVAGLCDLSASTVAQLARQWGVPVTTTDYRELIATPELDAILVCTYDHGPVVAEAIASGKHVLVEKPLAFTPEEGEALRVAADTAGVVAQLGYMKLFDPALARAVERLGTIGSPKSITCHDFAGSFARHERLYTQLRETDVPAEVLAAGRDEVAARIAARLGPAHAGYTSLYTLLLMLGSHDLAVLRTLFGTPERVAYAYARGDQQLLAVLDYPGGVPCVLEVGVGTSYAWWDEWVAIHGDDESLLIEFPNPYVRYGSTLLRQRETIDGAASNRVLVTSHEDPFRVEWLEFARCVHGEASTRAPLAGGVADLELAVAIILAMPPRPAAPPV
jgi:predicted dehydrogenase